MISWLKKKNEERLKRRRIRAVSQLRSLLADIDPGILRLPETIRDIELEARSFIKAGRPILIDLLQMEVSQISDLQRTELGQSLTRLSYVGSGAIIYYVDPDQIRIGAGTELRDFCIMEVGGTLNIGENCVIGAYNWLQSSGSITIGNGVIIGPHSCIISTSHERASAVSDVRSAPLLTGEVSIGENSWIGAHVSILMGVRIGRNVTIGAGSIVTRDIPDNATAFGSPCCVRETV